MKTKASDVEGRELKLWETKYKNTSVTIFTSFNDSNMISTITRDIKLYVVNNNRIYE